MNFSSTSFIISAVKPEQYLNLMPEIVLVGRSNVGKSSLINCLCNRKNLAKTSSVPGKTAHINYYNIANKLHLVDLPGYGYAKVSKTQKEMRAKMIDMYLSKSPNVFKIIQLIDSRHRPSDSDYTMLNWTIESGFLPIIIATKFDKLKNSAKEATKATLIRDLNLPEGSVFISFSIQTKEGLNEVRKLFGKFVEEFESLTLKDQC